MVNRVFRSEGREEHRAAPAPAYVESGQIRSIVFETIQRRWSAFRNFSPSRTTVSAFEYVDRPSMIGELAPTSTVGAS